MTAMDVAGEGAIKTLFSAEAIVSRVDQLASDIAATRLEDLVVVAVLKGSFIFAADLIRALHRHGLSPEIDFIYLASYDGERTSRGSANSGLGRTGVPLHDDRVRVQRHDLAGRKWPVELRPGCVLVDDSAANQGDHPDEPPPPDAEPK